MTERDREQRRNKQDNKTHTCHSREHTESSADDGGGGTTAADGVRGRSRHLLVQQQQLTTVLQRRAIETGRAFVQQVENCEGRTFPNRATCE